MWNNIYLVDRGLRIFCIDFLSCSWEIGENYCAPWIGLVMYFLQLFGWLIFYVWPSSALSCWAAPGKLEITTVLINRVGDLFPRTIWLVHLFAWPRPTYFLHWVAELLLGDWRKLLCSINRVGDLFPRTIWLVHLFVWPRPTYFLHRVAERLLRDWRKLLCSINRDGDAFSGFIWLVY